MGSQLLEIAGRFLIYSILLSLVNFLSAAHAINPDSDYKDAAQTFSQRDMVSTQKAISMLEKVLEQKPDHLDSQALIAYAYAHEAFILSQLGESGSDYQNSAEAFIKAVQAQQPQNMSAKKASVFLLMMSGKTADARKILEKDLTDKEADADIWYMYAIVGDTDKTVNHLNRALTLNPDHVWIYTDMAARALKMGDAVVAEKWIKALEAKRPAVAEVPLLYAVLAAQKKDKKRAHEQWAEFVRRSPDSPLVAKFSPTKKK